MNSSDDSADEIVQNGDDTPRTDRRNRKKRLLIGNFSFTSSIRSSAGNITTSNRSPPGNTHHKAAQIQQFEVNLNCNEPGQPSKVGCSTGPKPHENPTLTHLTQFGAVETYLYPAQVVQLQPVPPPLPQHQAPLQLQELVFGGLNNPAPV